MTEPVETSQPTSQPAAINQQDKNQIDLALQASEAKAIALKDVSGGQTYGTAYRLFQNGIFYHKAILRDLPSIDKGFYYEGWLVDPNGRYFSTSRVEILDNSATLYYRSTDDKSTYSKVVITEEADDNNPAPDKHILEGEF
jgi:hypothetical protein